MKAAPGEPPPRAHKRPARQNAGAGPFCFLRPSFAISKGIFPPRTVRTQLPWPPQDQPPPFARKKGLLIQINSPGLVGVARLELAASWTRTMRATKLRYTPPILSQYNPIHPRSQYARAAPAAKKPRSAPACFTSGAKGPGVAFSRDLPSFCVELAEGEIGFVSHCGKTP